jgi:hypothetical protein
MNTILQDEIFEKFGSEEEDTLKVLQDPGYFIILAMFTD